MINYYSVNPQLLLKYFEPQVREWCKECKRYDVSGSCPPNIMGIENFKTIFKSWYDDKIITIKFDIKDPSNWKEEGRYSSEYLRHKLYELVKCKGLDKTNDYTMYGGGSCKSCIKCTIPCSVPSKQLIALEATGINVIKMVKEQCGITLKFPIEKYGYFYRIGLILYHWRGYR